MSLFTISSRFLSAKPKVRIENDVLYARTAIIGQIASLFSYSKKLWVNRRTQTIELITRYLWFIIRRKKIPFMRVSYVDTEYRSYGTSWGITDESFFGRTDEIEKLRVYLVLANPDERIKLFSFVGEGSRQTGWVGVILGGDSMVDWRGDQYESAHKFAETLARMIGVPTGHPKRNLSV